MTVVSNTTPLNYLVLIGRVEILSVLYTHVIIPQAVFHELTSDRTPGTVRAWVMNAPAWLAVEQTHDITDSELQGIQIGERQTILLAEQIPSDFVILDDRKARRIANDRGLNVIGTLGILTAAAEKGLIRLSEALDDLKQTNFRASSGLLHLLQQQREE
jgi:predicted nucleic acid-binding protein